MVVVSLSVQVFLTCPDVHLLSLEDLWHIFCSSYVVSFLIQNDGCIPCACVVRELHAWPISLVRQEGGTVTEEGRFRRRTRRAPRYLNERMHVVYEKQFGARAFAGVDVEAAA